ncbi:Transcription factor 25 [Coemansia furcata]|uniref:Transcription factor 25 n=1 Tax=Coemansia furcata TaxID=417177 RepID=A0ACC1KS69_9FUNG|nr:Transcription factor 25 [Coemansia furcata]
MARLDFRYVESRTLYLALFRHMQFMARRGCWRTAFEVNKVLLSLDPVADPYGALLTLDFHALKSHQYEYVRQFVRDWSWSSVDLPNWAFSRALAEFMMEQQHGSAAHSMELLVQAILKFPTVVPVLWSKANVGVDDVVLTHPYFQDEVIADTSAMTHMQLVVQLFVERHTPLYRTPEVSRWMQEGLLLALESIAVNDTPQSKRDAQKRLCTYVIPENISRHVLVADLETIKAGLPEDIRTAESFAFDPLPPRDDVNVYKEIMRGDDGRGPRMPGTFEIDGEVYDMEDFEGEEGMGLLQQMMNFVRLRVGGAEVEDPGTSSDEEVADDQ